MVFRQGRQMDNPRAYAPDHMSNLTGIDKLVNFILAAKIEPADAIFAHGWGDLKDQSLGFLPEVFKKSGAKFLLLNAIENYQTGEPGFSFWKERLVSAGVPSRAVQAVGSGKTTLEEAAALAGFLKDKNISDLIVYSVPQHVCRAFLTDLEAIKKSGLTTKLHPLTLKGIDWETPVTIHNLIMPKEDTTRLGRFAAELWRISEYRERYERGEDYSIATAAEALKYLGL